MDGDHACNTMKKPFVLQYSTAPCSVVVLVVVVVAPPPSQFPAHRSAWPETCAGALCRPPAACSVVPH
jgi:hypothetical protein